MLKASDLTVIVLGQRKQAPEQTKWSSFGHYALRKTGVVEIDSEWTARDRAECASVPQPRLAPKKRARTRGTRHPTYVPDG